MKCFLIALVMGFSGELLAADIKKGIYASLSAGYYEFQDVNNPSTGILFTSTIDKDYNLSFKAGMSFQTGILVGFNYNMNKWTQEYKTETSQQDQTYDFKSYGPMLGVIFKDFHLIGTYYLSGEFEYTSKTTPGSTSTRHYSEGSGYQVDLGYSVKVSSSVMIGPQITYWKAKYKRADGLANNAVDSDRSFILFGMHVSGIF